MASAWCAPAIANKSSANTRSTPQRQLQGRHRRESGCVEQWLRPFHAPLCFGRRGVGRDKDGMSEVDGEGEEVVGSRMIEWEMGIELSEMRLRNWFCTTRRNPPKEDGQKFEQAWTFRSARIAHVGRALGLSAACGQNRTPNCSN